jgi:dynein heavy chain 2
VKAFSKYFLIIYRQTLQFRPPIEEIESKYYRELKRFISLPKHFKGVNETNKNLIFQTIIERNSEGLTTCYYRSEDLFKSLASVLDMFKVRDNLNTLVFINIVLLIGLCCTWPSRYK